MTNDDCIAVHPQLKGTERPRLQGSFEVHGSNLPASDTRARLSAPETMVVSAFWCLPVWQDSLE
jgi:hypothetical protein